MMVWVVEGGRRRVEWGRGIGLRGKGVEGGDQDLRGGDHAKLCTQHC